MTDALKSNPQGWPKWRYPPGGTAKDGQIFNSPEVVPEGWLDRPETAYVEPPREVMKAGAISGKGASTDDAKLKKLEAELNAALTEQLSLKERLSAETERANAQQELAEAYKAKLDAIEQAADVDGDGAKGDLQRGENYAASEKVETEATLPVKADKPPKKAKT